MRQPTARRPPADQQQAEPGDHQPELAAAERGQGQPQGHAPVPALVGGGHGQGEQAGGDRLGVELPADRPLHPRVGQVGDGHGQPGRRVAEVAAAEPVQDHRRQGQEQHLEQQQEPRVGPEPVQGGDQGHDVGGVLAQQVEPADGHERRPGPRQQPGPLVVDAEVEAVGPEAGVGRPGGGGEGDHEHGQGHPEGESRTAPTPRPGWPRPPAAPPGAGRPRTRRLRAGSPGGGASPTPGRAARGRPQPPGRLWPPARGAPSPTRGPPRARRSGPGAGAAARRPVGPAARPRRMWLKASAASGAARPNASAWRSG